MSELTAHDALVYVMVTMSAADTAMSDAELSKIGTIVHTWPVFEGFDSERLVEITRSCERLLENEEGLDVILDIAFTMVPERLYDTAYALAVEVAAADLHVEQEELRFLQMLRDRFDLDKLVVAAIERSARARFRKPE